VKVRVVSPTKCYVEEATPAEVDALKKQLTYTNTSVSYMYGKHKRNKWMRQNKPHQWQSMLQEYEAKLRGYQYFEDAGGLYFRPGFIPYLKKMEVQVVGCVERPRPRPVPWYNAPKDKPYPYQTETMVRLIMEGHGSAELATGLGKSYLMLLLARNLGLKTLIVTPSKSIFEEILETFRHHLGNGVGAFGDGKKKIGKTFTVAVAKSLTMVKEGTPEWEELSSMDVVISDESHTNPAATNERVFHSLLADVPYRFFVSATQTRGDGALPLLKSINGRCVYEKSIAEGIAEGYLCNLEFNVVPVVSRSGYSGADAGKMKRHHYLYNQAIMKHAVTAAQALWKSRGEQSLILVEEIEQISDLLKLIEVPATYVHGNTTKASELEAYGLKNTNLKEEIHRFNSGEVAIFIGTRCVSTGTNFYPTHNTFDLQGNSSEVGFFQGPVGRSTRHFHKSRYFTEKSVPKDKARIWMYRVRGVQLMENQLEKRIEMARTTGCPVLGDVQ
jgi:superfamily II DNA or RNA helicase